MPSGGWDIKTIILRPKHQNIDQTGLQKSLQNTVTITHSILKLLVALRF